MFVAEFSKPFKSFGSFHQNVPAVEGSRVLRGDLIYPDSRDAEGGYAGCYLNFSTTEGEQILVRIAMGRTVEEARAKLNAENPDRDFDGAVKQARDAWAEKLNLIQIEGGTDHERQFFYSTFYHCLYSPRLIAKRGQPFRGMDGERHVADYDRYTPIPFSNRPRPNYAADAARA